MGKLPSRSQWLLDRADAVADILEQHQGPISMAERIKELTAENGRLKGRHGRRAYEERIQQAEAALREVIKEAHDNPAGQSKEMHDILAKYKESGDVDIDDANVSDHEAGRDRLDYQPDEENSDDK